MKRITMSQKEIETKVEKALENACAYHACGQYKLMLEYYGEATGLMDILDDNDICYDDDCIINEHCHNMIELLEEEIYKLRVSYN